MKMEFYSMARVSKYRSDSDKPRKAKLVPGRGDVRAGKVTSSRLRERGKFAGQVVETFLDGIAAGLFQDDVCEEVGVTPSAVRWKKKKSREFRERYEVALLAGMFPQEARRRFLLACRLTGSVRAARALFGLSADHRSGKWRRIVEAMPGLPEEATEYAASGYEAEGGNTAPYDVWKARTLALLDELDLLGGNFPQGYA